MDQKGLIAAGAETGVVAGGGDKVASGVALLRSLGPGRILALGAVALLLLGFFAYIIGRASEPSYTLLFSGLELRDAQELTQRLDGLGVAYRLSEAGDAILVPSDEALRLRMSLAEEGLPVGNTVGYELFDQASPFTTSDFLGNVNLRRAIEGELARTIGTLRQVRAARVHIVEPKRSLFGREEVRPSASIVLALRRSGGLDRRQVAAIRHLVASAVPGLDAQSVTIVDDAGNLLAESADGDDDAAVSLEATEEQRVAFENRLRGKIVQLLERTLGAGKVDAAVSADLDFDEVATTAELFDPSTQVVRSTQTADETSDMKEAQAGEAVSVANNLPTERSAPQEGPGSSERKNRTEETVNYEISRTVRNQTKRGSTVRKLSIAVQVDGFYREQPDGTRSFEPRSAEELAQIEELVRSAAGADASRGDVVEVLSRPFLTTDLAAPADEPWSAFAGLDSQRLVELGVLGALTMVVLLFGIRPLLARLFPGTPALERGAGLPALASEPRLLLGSSSEEPLAGFPIATGQSGETSSSRLPALAAPRSGHDLKAPEARASSPGLPALTAPTLLDEVGEAIEARPEEAVRVIRTWLHGR